MKVSEGVEDATQINPETETQRKIGEIQSAGIKISPNSYSSSEIKR